MRPCLSIAEERAFRAKITAAFKSLRKHGYFARQNWKCCQTCGGAAIPEAKQDKYAFYHMQDDASISDGYCYIAWEGDGNIICQALFDAGLFVYWNGTNEQRICVSPEPIGDHQDGWSRSCPTSKGATSS